MGDHYKVRSREIWFLSILPALFMPLIANGDWIEKVSPYAELCTCPCSSLPSGLSSCHELPTSAPQELPSAHQPWPSESGPGFCIVTIASKQRSSSYEVRTPEPSHATRSCQVSEELASTLTGKCQASIIGRCRNPVQDYYYYLQAEMHPDIFLWQKTNCLALLQSSHFQACGQFIFHLLLQLTSSGTSTE